MAVLQISIADELKSRIEARATEAGCGSVQDYLEALMRADLEPEEVDDSDLEQLLLQRLDSGPGIEFTPEFAESFKREIRDRRQREDGHAS